jgi:hypothetical protein
MPQIETPPVDWLDHNAGKLTIVSASRFFALADGAFVGGITTPLHSWESHRLDAVAIGIGDEGGVIFDAVMRTQARRTVGLAA